LKLGLESFSDLPAASPIIEIRIEPNQNGSERAAVEGESNVKNGPSDAKNRTSIR
jgi:hypothetical protein